MVRIDPEQLERFAFETFAELGAPDPAADAVAESLVAADLRGHGSHGVMRIPNYVERATEGDIEPTATPTVRELAAQTVLVEGNRAFGQYVGRTAVNELVDRAGGGVAVAGIRDGTHLGRIGEWAERVASRGFLFAGLVSGTVPTVAPAGAAERRLSTNPAAFGVPTFDALGFPVVLDVATSQCAYGKIRERARTGDPIPEAWTVSESGEPVRDADSFQAGEGALRPLGGEVAGHKGYGLSIVVELFASFIGDAEPISEGSRPGGNAAAFVAIDPHAFSEEAALRERLASFASYLHDIDSVPGVDTGVAADDGVGLLPGESEHRTALDRADAGILLADGVAATLVKTAAELGLSDQLPDDLR